MVSWLKKNRACTYTLIVVMLVGLIFTSLLYLKTKQNEFQVWEFRATAEAERITDEILYRINFEREPLLAIATLYNGSEKVSAQELAEATAQFSSFTANTNEMAVGWFSQTTRTLEQMSGQIPGVLNNAPPPNIQRIIDQTVANGNSIYTAPLFQVDGESFLAMSIPAANDGRPGVLIMVTHFSDILTRVADDFLDQGKTLSIFKPDEPQVDHAQIQGLQTEAEKIHYINTEFFGNPLVFRWSMDADHSPLWQESNFSGVVVIIGLSLTLLVTFAYGVILFQNVRVETLVTQRTKQLQATFEGLQSAQQQLLKQDRLASLGKLVAGVSHELSTPISNAHMAANVLSDSVSKLEKAGSNASSGTLTSEIQKLKEASTLINSSTQRATDLISSFKEISVDNSNTRVTTVSLQGLVSEVISTMRTEIQARHLEVENQVDEDTVVETFAGQLATVLTHLLQNSVIHAYQRNKQGKIVIQATELESGKVQIQIQDFGVGMNKDVLEKIFEPFFTTKLGQGGSGLGMHVVYNSVDAVLGGEIQVDSEPNQGTCFSLTLPKNAPRPHAVENVQLDN